VSRHADAMDAHAYWRQFPVRIYWDAPKRVTGAIVRLDEEKTRDGFLPLVVLQLADGTVAEILVSQARLTAAFVEQRPAVGDRIQITYTGESTKSAPGMNPTKEFTLEVKRAESSQPQGRPPGKASGEVAGENGPGAGK